MTRPGNVLSLIFAVMTFLPSVAAATSLHNVSYEGDVAEVKRLIAAGAPVNAKDIEGETPLSHAYNVGVVKILEAAGGEK